MRTPLVWLLLLPALYAIGRWGGGLLATHHNDAKEIGATFVVAISAVIPFGLVSHHHLAGGTLALASTAVAIAAGLFAGYGRTG
jgi:hypothetical protein